MPLLKQLAVLAISRVLSITSFYHSISLVELRRKELTSRKSLRSSRSQTLFFGGTTGNTSAVRRLSLTHQIRKRSPSSNATTITQVRKPAFNNWKSSEHFVCATSRRKTITRSRKSRWRFAKNGFSSLFSSLRFRKIRARQPLSKGMPYVSIER